ncbi:MAG: efflux RND transporter periplasmic adaptor subunit [Deltaproteobacteria bacterium]|nr:efflux RND transporter periplasmic adaptor subunit [Deltaproteobacteria bacterium]
MNKRKLYAVIVVLALLLIGLIYLRNREGKEKYITAQVVMGDISDVVTATGTLSAITTVQVGSQVTGGIKTLYADFNSQVKKGQIVAQIDPDPFQAKVDSSKASLSAAKAAVTTARANIEKDKVNLEQVKRNLKRTDELFKKGIVSENDRDVAQTGFDSAVAQVKADEASYENAIAQVEKAKADLQSAELDLSHTRIISPVDGIVISRDVDVGQTVSASLQAPTLFVIAEDLTMMQLDASIVEADIGRVKVGQKATFTVDAYPGSRFTGEVTQVRNNPVTLQNVVTYDAMIDLKNPDLKLKPGMTANISILTAYKNNVLKIPNPAFRFRPELDGEKEISSYGTVAAYRGSTEESGKESSTNVWILSGKGKAVAVPVKIGIADWNFTELTDGNLKEGDRVIIGVISKEDRSSSSGRIPRRIGF